MRQRSTSIRPLTSISTMPPPAVPVTRRFLISSVIWPIWPPICWACFNRAPRLASPLNTIDLLPGRRIVNSYRLGAEQFGRPLDQRMLASPPAAAGGANDRARGADGCGRLALAARANSTRIGCPVTSASACSNRATCSGRSQALLQTAYPGLNRMTSRFGAGTATESNCLA